MNTHHLFAATGLALIMLQDQAFAQTDTQPPPEREIQETFTAKRPAKRQTLKKHT